MLYLRNSVFSCLEEKVVNDVRVVTPGSRALLCLRNVFHQGWQCQPGRGGSGARTGCVGRHVRGVRTLPIHFLYDSREPPSAEGSLKSCSLGLRVRELSDPMGEHKSFKGRVFP